MKRNKMIRNTLLVSTAMAAFLGSSALANAEEVVKVAVSSGETKAIELLKKYEEETGIKVEINEFANSSDMYTKIALMLQSEDTAPDVLFEDGFMVKTDAAAGLLEPLDDKLAEWDGWEQYSDAMKSAGQGMDGKTYAISIGTDIQVIWYNADVFEAAGLDPNWQPTSWDEILEVANTLKEANADNENFVPMFQWASTNGIEQTSMRTFQMMYAGTDGELYDYDTNQWIVDKANIRKVLSFVDTAWNEMGLCSTDLAVDADPDTVIVSDLFPNGNIGLFFSGSWQLFSWMEAGNYPWEGINEGKVKYAFLPTYDGTGNVTTSGGWTWAIPSKASNKEGGWELMKYLCSEENSTYHNLGSNIVPRNDSWESDAWTSQAHFDMISGFQDALSFTVFRPSVDGYSSVSELYAQMVENVALGIMSVDDAIATFETNLVSLMGEDGVIVIEE